MEQLSRSQSKHNTDGCHLESRQHLPETPPRSARIRHFVLTGGEHTNKLPEQARTSAISEATTLQDKDAMGKTIQDIEKTIQDMTHLLKQARQDKNAMRKIRQDLTHLLNQVADPLVILGQKRNHYDESSLAVFAQNIEKIPNKKRKLVYEVNESRTGEENSLKKFLVLFTGGTIGSIRLSNGRIVQPSEAKENGVDAGDAKSLLLDEFQKQYPEFFNDDSSSSSGFTPKNREPYPEFFNDDSSSSSGFTPKNREPYPGANIKFDTKILMETLSENMTLEKLGNLTQELKKLNKEFEQYDGIVLTHGSDTLGYTANYLSMVLAGIKVPMILVSSNFVLTDVKSNGVKNLKGAVDFISNVKLPGVYATYHFEGETKVIHGSRVGQCKPITDDFGSISIGEKGEKNMLPLGIIKENGNFAVLNEKLFKSLKERNQIKRDNLLDRIESLDARILVIHPSVGLDYNNFNLDNVDAILHTTYHSGTACTSGNAENLLEFAKKCREKGKDLYLGPIYGDAGRDVYSSTDKLYKSGISTIMNVSEENANIKLLIAYSLFKGDKNEKERKRFICENINEEFVKQASKLKRGSESSKKNLTAQESPQSSYSDQTPNASSSSSS